MKTSAIAESQQRSVLRTLDQPQLGFQHRDAGAFAAHQRARHVEATLGQQLIEVVARNAPGNFRITRADQLAVLIANRCQPGVNLALAPAAQR